MKKRSFWSINLFFTLFITLSSIKLGYAVSPAVHIAPKPNWITSYKPYDKKPLARDIVNGAYSELVEEQVNVEKRATYNHFITQIVSESGVQDNSDISVSFDPSFERLDFHEIIVWRNNKPQSRLNADAFKLLAEEDELDKFIYNGTFSAKYILPDIRKGDKIEYSYTVTGSNPILGDKFCRSIYLQGSNLILHQYTTLIFSATRQINIRSFNLRSQPKISIANGFKQYAWEDVQVPGITTNKLEAKWVNEFARVQVSDYASWAEVINWGLKINPIQTSFTGELADSIEKLKKKCGANKEKYFRDAVTFVQDEVRYMGIETGPYSHKANAPDKVFRQRYGDCKDKSLLLASILNAAGIEAHMALVNTDLQDKINDFIPSAALFDHAVVIAIIKGKPVWVDATMSNQGGKGTDLYFPDYREALVLKAGNTGLDKIAPTEPGKIVCDEKYSITEENLPVKFTVISNYTKYQADQIRDYIASSGTAQIEKDYLDYYSKTYTGIKAADSIIIKDNREKDELTTIESYSIPDYFKRDSTGKFNADFYADYISSKLPEITDQLKTAVAVNFPYAIDYKVHIILPAGWDMENVHYTINRDNYRFSLDKTVSGDDLTLYYQFAYLQNYIPADKLNEFKQDIKNLKDNQLYFNFSYIPDVDKQPFQLNRLMIMIAFFVIAVCGFFALRIYQKQTSDTIYYTRNSFPPVLGGWLIVLLIVLILAVIEIIYHVFDKGYFDMSQWDFFSTGLNSIINRILLIFELIGYTIATCYSLFCIALMLNRRDITAKYIKGYYVFIVAFLFLHYLFNAVFKREFTNDDVAQFIKVVIVSAGWTYYLNISDRAKQTLVKPYKNSPHPTSVS